MADNFAMPYWRLHYHLVWATHERLPLIGSEEEAFILESLAMTIARMSLIGHAFGMVADHVHVALSIPPTVAVADAAGRLKGASSRLINQRCKSESGVDFSWQSEYGVISITDRALPTVINYVRNQKQHHAENTLLKALELTSDARYAPHSTVNTGLS
jgi:putative transposase